MTAPAAPATERFTSYHYLLLVLLGIATLYEGFDASMLTLASPDVRATLGIETSEWGTLYGWTRVGLIASFFLLMCADRFGRRAMLLFTVAGFAITSGATAFAQTKYDFIAWQTLARLFLTAQYGLAIIIAGEELPARLRARGITALTSLAAVGTVLTAQVLPYFLQEAKGGEPALLDNWAHDGALALVASICAWLDLPFDGAHWRGLYLVGATPLLLLPFLAASVRETERYRQVAAQRSEGSLASVFRDQFRGAAQLFAPRYRRRFLIVALLWNCVYLVIAPSVAYWSIYAREEVGMSVQQVGNVITVAYIFGALGHLVSGQLVDRVGRKITCAGFFALGAVAIVMLFHTRTIVGQYGWHISTVFLLNAAIGATHVYASELFPTELRATGYGWSTNFFGRATEFIPVLIGFLIGQGLSITSAITIVGIGPILGALLIAKYALETRGLTLEQIQEKLDHESAAGAARAPA
ncbi:MAG: MFS transporter [Deltaproteobacteria bacterium]|nr:MFS transporter [Deltaproteobacteria bacterium]